MTKKQREWDVTPPPMLRRCIKRMSPDERQTLAAGGPKVVLAGILEKLPDPPLRGMLLARCLRCQLEDCRELLYNHPRAVHELWWRMAVAPGLPQIERVTELLRLPLRDRTVGKAVAVSTRLSPTSIWILVRNSRDPARLAGEAASLSPVLAVHERLTLLEETDGDPKWAWRVAARAPDVPRDVCLRLLRDASPRMLCEAALHARELRLPDRLELLQRAGTCGAGLRPALAGAVADLAVVDRLRLLGESDDPEEAALDALENLRGRIPDYELEEFREKLGGWLRKLEVRNGH